MHALVGCCSVLCVLWFFCVCVSCVRVVGVCWWLLFVRVCMLLSFLLLSVLVLLLLFLVYVCVCVVVCVEDGFLVVVGGCFVR